jgi:hypothetical protein
MRLGENAAHSAIDPSRGNFARASAGYVATMACLLLISGSKVRFLVRPPLKSQTKCPKNAGLFPDRRRFGSAPGKHFLQNQVGVPGTRVQGGHPGHGPIERRFTQKQRRVGDAGGAQRTRFSGAAALATNRDPIVGVTKTEASWPAPRPLPLQRRIRPPTVDHPQRLWDLGAKSLPAHLRFFSKKLEGVLENREGREFSGARAWGVYSQI